MVRHISYSYVWVNIVITIDTIYVMDSITCVYGIILVSIIAPYYYWFIICDRDPFSYVLSLCVVGHHMPLTGIVRMMIHHVICDHNHSYS